MYMSSSHADSTDFPDSISLSLSLSLSLSQSLSLSSFALSRSSKLHPVSTQGLYK